MRTPNSWSSQEHVVFSRDVFPALYKYDGNPDLTVHKLKQAPAGLRHALRNRYLTLMSEELGEEIQGRFHIDKNPNHTSLMLGLYRLFPESRFLVALRNPRDVLVSCYFQWLPMSEFSAAFLTPGQTCFLYAFEMSVWQRMRGLLSRDWLEVRYESVVEDLPAQARRVLEFLDLPWSDDIMAYRDRLSAKRINSPTHEEVRRPIYTHAVGRWQNYEKFLGRYFERLEPMAKSLGY